MNYTSEMEKAMHQTHGVNFAEYSRKLSHRIKVEKAREKSHKQSMKVYNEIERLAHR
ncbi:hypothetical protein [Aquibacillus kalidii]|uniref:hypothetical protein n=1 Tax=Aquibacillus kalidii TaxID=2762597 RepID=UPI001C995374|nr:hypothetical protein [Aquibacillus kalidii]